MANNFPFNLLGWVGGSAGWFTTTSSPLGTGWLSGSGAELPDAGTDAQVYVQNITVGFAGGTAAAQSLSMQGAGIGLGATSATLAMSAGALTLSRGSPVGNVAQTGGTLTFRNGIGHDQNFQPPVTDYLHPGEAGTASAIYNLSQSAAGTILIESGSLTLLGTASSVAGTIGGKGTLADPVAGHVSLIVSGIATLAGSAVLAVDTLAIQGTGATLTLGGSRSFGDALQQGPQTLLKLNGKTLTLTGTAALSGEVQGPGRLTLQGTGTANALTLSGGAILDVYGSLSEVTGFGGWFNIGTGSGGSATAGTAIVRAGGSLTFAADLGATLSSLGAIRNAGTFGKTGGTGESAVLYGSVTSTGTVVADTGKLLFAGGTGSFGGRLTGTGTIELGGGDYVLAKGVVVDVAALRVVGTGAHLALQGSVTYAGSYTQGGVVQALQLGGNQMTLTGKAAIGGAVQGPGKLVLAGFTTLTGTTVFDGATLENRGFLTQSSGFFSNLNIGTTPADAAKVVNAKGATWTIDEDVGAVLGAAAGLTNAGLFQKTGGAGTYTVAGGTVVNSGTLAAASGRILLAAPLTNTGILAADGGWLDIQGAVAGTGSGRIAQAGILTFHAGVAATQTIAFGKGAGTLDLRLPAGFAGSVTGYAAGNIIDIHGQVATGAVLAGGIMTVTLAGGGTVGLKVAGTATQVVPVDNGVGGTWLVAAATGPVALTTGKDVVYFAGGTNTVTANSATLNPGDRLGGAGGTDTLVLSGGGAFDLAALARFSGFEQVVLGNLATEVTLRAATPLTVTGGKGADVFHAGTGAFGAAWQVNGGAGADTLALDGDFSAGVVLGAVTLTNVETILLAAGHSYGLTSHDATVAAGTVLTVDAQALLAGQALTFDGAAETDGRFLVRAGAGADWIRGGAGNDSVLGIGAGDTVAGGDGRDLLEVWAAPGLVDGGAGTDTLRVMATVAFAAGSLAGIEIVEVADGASADLSALSAAVTLQSLSVAGGAGATLQGTAGKDRFNAAAGVDRFVFAPGHGKDMVVGFDAGPGGDLLVLLGVTPDFADVLAHVTHVGTGGADLRITYGADTITLTGVAAIDADHVLFA